VEAENATTLASSREDADGLVQRVTLLEGELVEARWAWEVAEENFHGLFDVAADGARWLLGSERERQEHFEELTICHTPFRESGNETFIRVPRMFKSHVQQQHDKQVPCSIIQSNYLLHNDPWVWRKYVISGEKLRVA
jgi:hypothetical protein